MTSLVDGECVDVSMLVLHCLQAFWIPLTEIIVLCADIMLELQVGLSL